MWCTVSYVHSSSYSEIFYSWVIQIISFIVIIKLSLQTIFILIFITTHFHFHFRSHLASFSPACKDFICKLLDLDPMHRMSPEEAMNHPWVALPNPTITTKPKIQSSNMNVLKLLNCIRSRSPAQFHDSTEKEKNKPDFDLTESLNIMGNLDVERPKKDQFLALSNSKNHSNTTSTNTSAVGSPTHSSSALHTTSTSTSNQPLQLNKLDLSLDMPSPDKKKTSKGKGFFTTLYSAVRNKDSHTRRPDILNEQHHHNWNWNYT